MNMLSGGLVEVVLDELLVDQTNLHPLSLSTAEQD